MDSFIFGSTAEAVDAENSSDKARAELRKTLEQKTAEFIAAGGVINELGVMPATAHKPVWESSSSRAISTQEINQRIKNEYPTVPSPTALARELGITLAALRRRAGRLDVVRVRVLKGD